MAQIQEQTVVIRLSKLLKANTQPASNIGPVGFEDSLEAIVSELISDDSVIVEVEAGD